MMMVDNRVSVWLEKQIKSGLFLGVRTISNRISNEQKKKIGIAVVKMILSGGFNTHRGNFKIREKVSLKDYDTGDYAKDEESVGGDNVRYFKNALLYLPDLLDMLFGEFDETEIKEEEAIFFYHIKGAIIRGITQGNTNTNEFTDKYFPQKSVNPAHIVKAIDKVGNVMTIIINADSFYRDLFMNALMTIWQIFLTWSENYDPQCMKDYGHSWFEQLKKERQEYNIKVLEELYRLEYGETIKVINTDGKYNIIKLKEEEHDINDNSVSLS